MGNKINNSLGNKINSFLGNRINNPVGNKTNNLVLRGSLMFTYKASSNVYNKNKSAAYFVLFSLNRIFEAFASKILSLDNKNKKTISFCIVLA